MSFMVAFGVASIMLCVGMILRTKISLLRNMLVPASVIAGLVGMITMNTGMITSTDAGMFTSIVNYLFTLTFISIGLTSSKARKNSKNSIGKEIAKGSIGMGILWNLMYALTPVIGILVLLTIGGYFGMNPLYGLLVPLAFAQGPGQASVFGTIFEQQYGIENAAMVGLTFAVIGFIACFLVGIPLAKYGMRKGLAKNINSHTINDFITRGYYTKNDKRESMGDETIYSGNMDTMTYHFAIMGICFVMALGIAELISLIPGMGPSLSGMLFVYGLLAAYIVKLVMKKLNIDYMMDNTFQTKITGWATDYLIVTSFMAVKFSVIGAWVAPILIGSILIIIVILFIVMYFGKRLGGEDDFARTLGLYGTVTGTVPSGIMLIRIIDPSLRTNAAVELGLMNVPMIFSGVTITTILTIASGAVSLGVGLLLLLAPIPIYLIVLKVFKMWGKKTYDFKGRAVEEGIAAQAERKDLI